MTLGGDHIHTTTTTPHHSTHQMPGRREVGGGCSQEPPAKCHHTMVDGVGPSSPRDCNLCQGGFDQLSGTKSISKELQVPSSSGSQLQGLSLCLKLDKYFLFALPRGHAQPKSSPSTSYVAKAFLLALPDDPGCHYSCPKMQIWCFAPCTSLCICFMCVCLFV